MATFDERKPNAGAYSATVNRDGTRDNLVYLRECLVAGGTMPGYDCASGDITYNADGTVATAEGTLGADGAPRLVKWGDFEIEASLGGHTLVVTNLDKPGVIGFLGTALGNAGVNISRVHLGVAGGAGAVSVWNLDSGIPASVLDELRRSPNVSSAIAVTV